MASYIFYGATEPTKLTVIVSAKVGSLKGYRDHHSASFTATGRHDLRMQRTKSTQMDYSTKLAASPSAPPLNGR